ncbi:MAG: signal peptide peptidase SppA [Deltaproteobacteria bacterium]|nr:signal peptide peptidase SppA [Deltaproteobacteria bacterium]
MSPSRALLVLLALFGSLFVMFVVGLGLILGADRAPSLGGRPRVGVVEVTDAITDSKEFTERLQRFLAQDSIKAIVVRVDSPGGSVGPSQEMRSEIIRARGKKPVVASLGSVAASGGFYVAVGAQKVVSNPGTLTGSIGVIMQHPVLVELMKTARVDMATYASGALKNTGSPFHVPTPDERRYLQGITEEIHAQFVDAVADSRQLPRDQVAAVADGRVITGARAKELGLVDELGTLQDAARLALKLAGVEGDPELVYPPRKGGMLAELLEEGTQGAWRGVVKAVGPGMWRLQGVLPTLEVAPSQAR